MVYKVLLTIHILSAIVGIGSTFLFPLILAIPKKVKELQLALRVLNKGADYPKFGAILLLLSGLGMGALNTELFQKGWYITAIILLLTAVLIYILRILPRLKTAIDHVADIEGEEIPQTYYDLKNGIKPFMITASAIDVIIILLMIWKPF
ncbi:DUF2269 family protein [Rossellomorea aquimaris]|uniref:DUF2269 family protein n=1 Tax=Rossellomorea aquimaris TaxID=189382 RepID=UPI001CD2751F|nr:DUF2269 family protein [Rossellomorea aquimaris]MCA1055731.1 DUF2269 family protein [Rossellomorea aquimaris]